MNNLNEEQHTMKADEPAYIIMASEVSKALIFNHSVNE